MYNKNTPNVITTTLFTLFNNINILPHNYKTNNNF